MVEEKKKRGRPKKSVTDRAVNPTVGLPSSWGYVAEGDRSQSYRRDELVVQMVMGVINKSGTIKYDFAKDLFNTATQLAYDFGWMEKPKEKKKSSELDPVFDPRYVVEIDATGPLPAPSPQANTPADIIRQLRGDS